MQNYEFNGHLIELVDIDSIEKTSHINMVDIEVEEDHTFTLANGIISHNSASKSVQAARGKNPYIGSFPLKGKPLSVTNKDIKRVMENEEIKKILTITGLKIGERVDTVPLDDGEWVELNVDGKTMIVNENDIVIINGREVRVSDYI